MYNSLTSIAHSLRKILSEDCGTSQAAQGRTKPHKDAQVEFDGYVRRWRHQWLEKARGRTRLHRDAQSCTNPHKVAQNLTNGHKIAQIHSKAHNAAQKARARVFLSEKRCHTHTLYSGSAHSPLSGVLSCLKYSACYCIQKQHGSRRRPRLIAHLDLSCFCEV